VILLPFLLVYGFIKFIVWSFKFVFWLLGTMLYLTVCVVAVVISAFNKEGEVIDWIERMRR